MPSALAQPCLRNESIYICALPDAYSTRSGGHSTPSFHPRQRKSTMQETVSTSSTPPTFSPPKPPTTMCQFKVTAPPRPFVETNQPLFYSITLHSPNS
ncbi:unnamed protein product [Taenia asiatica]|uniref:Uncharacterized protein n=1 Tax=Taenia asiatica TaxID=60517 RepID=A0A3P6Q875_TAEAS|nr:unnamed protein product [Taenia asiatica]